MKPQYLFVVAFTFLSSNLFGQINSALDQSMNTYKKLYLEGKISGNSFMTFLYMTTTLSVAESQGKLNNMYANNEKNVSLTETDIVNAWNLILGESSSTELASATSTILQSSGVSSTSLSSVNTDVMQILNAMENNKTTFSNSENLSDGLSFLALKSAGMDNLSIAQYSGGSVFLDEMTGAGLYNASEAIQAFEIIRQEIQLNAQLNLVNRQKKQFFDKYILKFEEHSEIRDTVLYPYFSLNKNNFTKYVNRLNYLQKMPATFNTRAINFSTESKQDEIYVYYKDLNLNKFQQQEYEGDQYSEYYTSYPLFIPSLKFDFTQDFRFTMKVKTDQKGWFRLRINIGDYYTINFLPYCNSSRSSIVLPKTTRYNPTKNRLECVQEKSAYGFNTGKGDKEFVIEKKGNKIITYFVNEENKTAEFIMDNFPNRDGFRIYISTMTLDKSDYFIINDMSLKYTN